MESGISTRQVLVHFYQSNKLITLFRQGGPRRLTSDDVYHDYHIPTNSIVIPNQW